MAAITVPVNPEVMVWARKSLLAVAAYNRQPDDLVPVQPTSGMFAVAAGGPVLTVADWLGIAR